MPPGMAALEDEILQCKSDIIELEDRLSWEEDGLAGIHVLKK